jgi:hypothetical protein
MSNVNLDPHATETQRRFNHTLGFLKNVETKYPELSRHLPCLLSKLLGDKSFDPSEMIQNEGNINGGLAYLGSWLNQSGFGGFEVKDLSLTDMAVKAGASLKIRLPVRDEFFTQSGVHQNDWLELQGVMEDLSKTVGGMLEIGYQPKQVIAALFIQSTAAQGNERPETSLPTRDMLIKVSGNQLGQVNQILNRWMQGQ